jgi:hypothetical protein
MEYSGAGGKLIHEKNQKQKIYILFGVTDNSVERCQIIEWKKGFVNKSYLHGF